MPDTTTSTTGSAAAGSSDAARTSGSQGSAAPSVQPDRESAMQSRYATTVSANGSSGSDAQKMLDQASNRFATDMLLAPRGGGQSSGGSDPA